MSDTDISDLSQEGRNRILAAALDLLTKGGRDALTTRAAASAAAVQAPTIYRLFGDKQGLIDAVAEHGFRAYLQRKLVDAPDTDPVENLRLGWDLQVGCGLANPAIFTAMYGDPKPGRASAASQRALNMLRDRMRGLALAGRLRVDETRAADIVRAAACGVVFILLEQPEDERDLGISVATREAVIAAIIVERSEAAEIGLAPVAASLRARLPEAVILTAAERGVLNEWLGRIIQRKSLPPHAGNAEP